MNQSTFEKLINDYKNLRYKKKLQRLNIAGSLTKLI